MNTIFKRYLHLVNNSTAPNRYHREARRPPSTQGETKTGGSSSLKVKWQHVKGQVQTQFLPWKAPIMSPHPPFTTSPFSYLHFVRNNLSHPCNDCVRWVSAPILPIKENYNGILCPLKKEILGA